MRRDVSLVVISTLLLLLLVAECVDAEFLTTPTLLWTHRIPGGGSLNGGRNVRKGNAVVATTAPHRILVTADDGTLHILDPTTMSDSILLEPPISPGTYREGRSSVALVMNSSDTNVVDFVVYAVIDTPEQVGIVYVGPLGDMVNTTTAPTADDFWSRVIAVDLSGSLLWAIFVPGCVAGTPVVSTDQGKIFVVHNYDDATGASQGYISIISRNGTLLGTKVNSRLAPFGPPAIQSISAGRDVVVVAESWDDGFGLGNGQVQLLVPSAQYDALNGAGGNAYEWVNFSNWKFPAVAAPLVKDDLVWIAGQGSTLAGWTTINSVLLAAAGNLSATRNKPTWQINIQPSERNSTEPLGSTPAISSDRSRLYLNGASIDFFCVDAATGKLLWNDTSGWSIHTAEPKLTEVSGQGSVVYAIESLTGTIKQFDAQTGKLNWAFGCEQITGIQNCANAVEAEFSVSNDGNELYFGDIFGNIYAIQVADFVTLAPTTVPTTAPTVLTSSTPPVQVTPPPTSAPITANTPPIATPNAPPVAIPTNSPVSTSNPSALPESSATPKPTALATSVNNTLNIGHAEGSQHQSSDNNSLPTILGSVVGVLAFLAVLVGLFVYRYRRHRKTKLDAEREEREERWRQQRAEYEEECRLAEEEEIQEIVAATTIIPTAGAILTTPTKEKKRRKKAKKAKSFGSPITPSTLSSIEELPDEIDSIGSDRRGRRQIGNRSRSLDRLLAKLMRIKSEKPPARNLETAFENVAEEDLAVDTSTEQQPGDDDDDDEDVEEQKVEGIELIDQADIAPDLLVDNDDGQTEQKSHRGARSKSVGPGLHSSQRRRVNRLAPQARRSQSLERILRKLRGAKPIRGEEKETAAPPNTNSSPTTETDKVITSILIGGATSSEVEVTDFKLDSDLGRSSPIQDCVDHMVDSTENGVNANVSSNGALPISSLPPEPENCDRAKSPVREEIDPPVAAPISPIPSIGSSSHGRGRPALSNSRASSMSPTSFLSSSSFSLDGYSLPGEDHSTSTGSGVAEEILMLRQRDLDIARNVVRPSHSPSEDDRLPQVGRPQSPVDRQDMSSARTQLKVALQQQRPNQNDAIFPQLPGQNRVSAPEDLLSVDSSLYLEDSRSQGALSPDNTEQPQSILENRSVSSPQQTVTSVPKSDTIFPQLPGPRKPPASADVVSLGSLYLDDNSVAISAITYEREKDDASVLSGATPGDSRSSVQDRNRPKPTLVPPEGCDPIEEDVIPPGSHYVRRPQAPGQASHEKGTTEQRILDKQEDESLRRRTLSPDIDISASSSRYSRSNRKPTPAVNTHRSRELNVENPSPRIRQSRADRQNALLDSIGDHQRVILDSGRMERRSHSVASGRSTSSQKLEAYEGKVYGDSDSIDDVVTLRTRNSFFDRLDTSTDRSIRGMSIGAETRISTASGVSGDSSDNAVADTPERPRRTTSVPPKSGGAATDSWSKFLKELASAERAFFYPSLDIPTIKDDSGDEEESEGGGAPPPPPVSPPPPRPPTLPRPVGEDTRRRLV